jgi:TPR repeat protein
MNAAARFSAFFLLSLALYLPSGGPASAQGSGRAVPRSDPFIEQSQAFLDGHPDIKYRNLGFRSYKKGEFADAMDHFRRAAYFADKPSQAMIGEMHWKGEGVPVNKAQAYAWLDLASERQYPNLLLVRERFWDGLDAAQQTEAVRLGEALYARYGDDVAKTRLEAKLRSTRANTTGSRTGFVGSLTVYLAGPDGEGVAVDGSQFYQEQYWKPEQYWQWQDRTWKVLSRGNVRASELQALPSKPTEIDKP